MDETRYEFRVCGRMSATAVAAFPDLVVHEQPVNTTLFGPIGDDAQLQGIIGQLLMMGYTLTDVHRLPD